MNPLAGDEIIGQPQGRRFFPLMVLSYFGAAIMLGAINGTSIPKLLTLLDASSKEANLALISSIGGIVVVIVAPLLGRLSDRTMSTWGMRKPWYAIGLVIVAVGVVILALSTQVWGLVLGWAVFQVGYASIGMAGHALLADQVPARIRGRVTGATGAASGIATVVAALVVSALPIDMSWTWFVVPGALGILTVLPMFFAYTDARRESPPERLRLRDIISTYWLNPFKYRDFALAWTSRFFMGTAVVAVSLYLFFLIVDTLGYSLEEAGVVQATVLSVFFVGQIVATVFFGWLSDKLRRRKVIVAVSGMLVSAGVVIVMLPGGMQTFLIGFGVIGFALGAYVTVDVALLTEVLPSREDVGKDLGIVSLSYQLPQVIAPAAAGLFISLAGGYDGLYVFAIVCSAIGALAVVPIRGVK